MTGNHPAPWPRIALTLAALIVYGAGASWIVGRAGASYRASLSRAEATPPPTIARVEDPPPPTEPEPSRPPSWEEESAHDPPAPAPTEAAEGHASEEAPHAVEQPEPTGPAVVVDPIWSDPRVTKRWDIDHLTIAQEKELGESLKMLILALNAPSPNDEKLVGARTSADRVFAVAQDLLEKMPRKRKEIEYEFIVLDSLEPNAFSIPGGTIFVTEGLLLSIGQDEPHVLQFLLAHEIAHVDEQHAIQCLHFEKLWDLREKVGTAELLYRYVLPNAYFDGQEFTADHLAATALGKMGYGRYEKLAYLRKLQHYAEAHGFARGHELPRVAEDRTLLDNHIRAHVSAVARLKKVKEWIDAKPSSVAPRK